MAGLTPEQQAALDEALGPVTNRRQPGETVEAYRARLSQTTMATPPGAVEANRQALASMPPPPQPSVMGDVARAVPAGLARGTAQLVGLPGSLDNLISAGLEKLGIMPSAQDLVAQGVPADVAARVTGNPLSGGNIQGAMASATNGATEYRGQTLPGQVAGTMAEFVPAALLPGATVKNAVQFAVLPGAASEAAGQLTEGTAYEPWARAAAAILAPLAVPLGARIISPNGGADPARLAMAETLDQANIPVSAGQRVGNMPLQRREVLTGAGGALREAQTEAFTKATLAQIGETASRATPEVMDSALRRIGAEFDAVSAGVDVMPTPQVVSAMRGAVETYKELAPTAGQAPAVSNIFNAIAKAYRSQQPIPAENLMTWRSRLNKLTTSADGATRDAAIEGLDALDNALNDTLTALGRSDDIARLATARAQYRNYLAIERAVSMAGNEAAFGLISPARLASAVKSQSHRAYVTGRRGDIADLARAGVGVLERPNTSGTLENAAAAGMTVAAPGMVGAVIGGALAGAPGAAVGTALGALAPYASRAMQASRPGQAYLANQAINPQLLPLSRNALAALPGPAGQSLPQVRP